MGSGTMATMSSHASVSSGSPASPITRSTSQKTVRTDQMMPVLRAPSIPRTYRRRLAASSMVYDPQSERPDGRRARLPRSCEFRLRDGGAERGRALRPCEHRASPRPRWQRPSWAPAATGCRAAAAAERPFRSWRRRVRVSDVVGRSLMVHAGGDNHGQARPSRGRRRSGGLRGHPGDGQLSGVHPHEGRLAASADGAICVLPPTGHRAERFADASYGPANSRS